MFFRDRKVLVTGGTGFIGRHMVEALLAQGARVRVSVHERPLAAELGGAETVPADLSRLEDCRAAARGMEFVLHCAGAVSAAGVTARSPMAAITTNLVLTAQMLQGAWLEGVERFLVFSSSTGYPASDAPIREDEMWSGPTHPSYFGYGWMRRYLERLSEFVASKSDMKIALARPTAVYGRHDNFDPATSHVIPALVRRALERENPYIVWGTGEEVRDFLHVTDLVRGCLLLLERHPDCDPVNLGYGGTVTIREVVQHILAAAGHRDARVEFDTSKPSTIPVRVVDTAKARTLLGFSPQVLLADGLADTVAWYRSHRGSAA